MSDEERDSLLSFPCDFPIKAIGKSSDHIDSKVATIVRKHVPNLTENAITSRHSKDGNYLSVTVMVRATSQEQLDAIYHELSAADEIIMAL